MKRALLFLLAALFILLVVDPNLTSHLKPEMDKLPVYDQNAALRTNDDVETKQSSSHALILIDPTRGGSDIGYTSSSTIPEKELLMQMALTIGTQLEKAGYRVAYTRWYDDVPACDTVEACEDSRLDKARNENADYILSLAFNQDKPLHRGYSIFTQPDNPELAALASNLNEQIQATSFSRSEGLDTDHYDAFPILRDTTRPALLLQLGYITNPQDYAKLADSKFQGRLAQAISQAFLDSID